MNPFQLEPEPEGLQSEDRPTYDPICLNCNVVKKQVLVTSVILLLILRNCVHYRYRLATSSCICTASSILQTSGATALRYQNGLLSQKREQIENSQAWSVRKFTARHTGCFVDSCTNHALSFIVIVRQWESWSIVVTGPNNREFVEHEWR